MASRRRGTKTTRRPAVRPPAWKRLGWRDAPNANRPAPADTSPWADVQTFLGALLTDRKITGLAGHAGSWSLTLPSGRVLLVVADEASREEMSILGSAR